MLILLNEDPSIRTNIYNYFGMNYRFYISAHNSQQQVFEPKNSSDNIINLISEFRISQSEISKNRK